MSTKSDQVKDLLTLQERMNQIFKEVIQPPSVSIDTWSPLVDIYEVENEIVIKVDLPEVDQKKIYVSLEGEKLTITGERSFPKGVDQEKFYRIERFYGNFSRDIILPYNIDQEKINADYKNGVLTITLFKLAPKLAKQIMVKID
jgi:HSP20 family protein